MPVVNTALHPIKEISNDSKAALYDSLQLGSLGLSRTAYRLALEGYKQLLSAGKIQNNTVLSIIDFNLPSSKKRLFVIDMKSGELLFNTFVSHGKNSGKVFATTFSNKPNSHKSSLGFYVTKDTYIGKNGYSLRLDGKEKRINDNARRRGIVIHGAGYADESFIEAQGFLGRSEGCPAIPEAVSRLVIETIKKGSCLFVYSANKFYVTHSKLIGGGGV